MNATTATAPAPPSAPAPAHAKHPLDPIFATPDFRSALRSLGALRDYLNATVLERGEVIDGLLAAMLAGENMLLLGPPGTGKSYLMNALARQIHNPADGASARMCYYLLTKTTKPEELLGGYDIDALEHGVYRHQTRTAGLLAPAHFALLEEIGRASSALLNSLLGIINERTITNGGEVESVDLITLIGSSNDLPQDPVLAAFMDRLPLRFVVKPLSDSGFAAQLRAEGQKGHKLAHLHGMTKPVPPVGYLSLPELFILQQAASKVIVPASVEAILVKIRTELRGLGVVPSDRRFLSCYGLIRANTLLHGEVICGPDHLGILAHALWDRQEESATVAGVVGKQAAPAEAKISEFLGRLVKLNEEFKAAITKANQGQNKATERTAAGIATRTGLASLQRELNAFSRELETRGSRTEKIQTRLEGLDRDINGLVSEIISVITDIN